MSEQEKPTPLQGRPATQDEIAYISQWRELKDKSIERVNQALLWLIACSWSLFNVCVFIFDKTEYRCFILGCMVCLLVSVGCAFAGLLPSWFKLPPSPSVIETFLIGLLRRKWWIMVISSTMLLVAGLLLLPALFLMK